MRKPSLKISLAGFLFISIISTHAQDLAFGKKIVDTLTSPYFWGRGYTNNGMDKAAKFLAEEFRTFGLIPQANNSFFQTLSYPVNTFPGKMEVSLNGTALVPGKDFIVGPESRGVKGKGELYQVDSATFVLKSKRIVLKTENKLTWSVEAKAEDYTLIQIDKYAIDFLPQTIEVNIEHKEIKNFSAANVCGMVKGTEKPDSFLVFTAHYDHLGGMGKDTYFPGANDNASGVALLLNLARYYAQHPQPYSIAFICFAGEEAGVLGSKYYSEHPLIDLSKIRFLMNTDLAGTGEDGITVVNATVFPVEFEWLKKVNEENNLLKAINPRGKAAISDHYFFTEKGVPSIFFYTQGGISAYHDIFDRAETLPLNEHEDLFTLLMKFSSRLMGE